MYCAPPNIETWLRACCSIETSALQQGFRGTCGGVP